MASALPLAGCTSSADQPLENDEQVLFIGDDGGFFILTRTEQTQRDDKHTQTFTR